MSELEKLLPAIDENNRPFFEGLSQGRLRLPRCEECGKPRYHPTRFCPACGSDRSAWVELSGRGQIWARCAFHQVYFEAFRDRVPYGVVIVELEEGPRVYANLASDYDIHDVPVSTKVEAVFEAIEGGRTLLKFRPVQSEEQHS